MPWHLLIQEIINLLNRYHSPDPRFCQWAYQTGVGIYYACS